MSEIALNRRGEIGKYRLVAEIARGGMGIVYLAVMHGFGGFQKLLVIKELKPELAEDQTFLAMFLEEARLAARLSHPNVVQTFEVGNDGPRHFIAMEYLEGRTLNRVVRRFEKAGRPLSLGMHLRILREVLRGLDYAHTLKHWDGTPLGIVHRDVSPPNVFLTFDGQVKLVDFGVAKAADSSLETKSGMVKGKITYMSPEQIQGTKLDARADVFAVGVMLWEALCGRRMWAGKGDMEVLTALVKEDVPAPSTVVPDVPPELNEICMRALACDRERRFASAVELEIALEKYATKHGLDVSASEIGASMTQLFADERKRVHQEIEAYLSRALEQASSGNVPAFAGPETGAAPRVTSSDSSGGYPALSEAQSVSVSVSAPVLPNRGQDVAAAPEAQPMFHGIDAEAQMIVEEEAPTEHNFAEWVLAAAAVLAAIFLGLTIARRVASASPPPPPENARAVHAPASPPMAVDTQPEDPVSVPTATRRPTETTRAH